LSDLGYTILRNPFGINDSVFRDQKSTACKSSTYIKVRQAARDSLSAGAVDGPIAGIDWRSDNRIDFEPTDGLTNWNIRGADATVMPIRALVARGTLAVGSQGLLLGRRLFLFHAWHPLHP
jgi:hypothetical protein